MRVKLLTAIDFTKNVVLVLIFSAVVRASNYYVADPRGADGVAGNGDDVNSSDNYDRAHPGSTLCHAHQGMQCGHGRRYGADYGRRL